MKTLGFFNLPQGKKQGLAPEGSGFQKIHPVICLYVPAEMLFNPGIATREQGSPEAPPKHPISAILYLQAEY